MDNNQDRESTEPVQSNSRWGRATSDAGDDRREALSELAASYYYCVYAWWRRSGREAEAAATATLAFFDRWLSESPPQRTDSGVERMRTWLLERLAELSGETLETPVEPPLALDPAWAEARYADEPPGEADAIFQRRWALTVLEFTVATMRAEYTARGEEALFPELVPFAGYDSGEEDRYLGAADRTGLTVGAMHKEVFDFRHRQRELLLYFAGDTLLDPAEATSEITALLCACDAPGPEAATARLPTEIANVHPDEMLARAMQSVRMTGGGALGWQPPTVAEAARLFPQYEVSALLGRGGMGAVYQGRQVELDRAVAIKLLPLEVSVDRAFADRFRREARAMARLQHPNIIDVYDFGTTSEGHLFFVMEFVEGTNLDAMIRGPGLAPAQALQIVSSVCEALAYAHAEGVVHRDIKPANVMVSKKGKVKVADFGLAQLSDSTAEQLGHTVTGTVMGTPDYMAPEQKRGMHVDHRADIYSLGVMLYEMLCREVPQGIFDPPSHRVAVDSRVDQVVIKAMQQQPDRRFQSTQEMKTAVDAASAPQPLAIAKRQAALARLPDGGMSRAMTMPPHARPARSKKPLFAGLAVLAVGAALLVLQPWKKNASEPRTPTSRQAAAPAVSTFGPWQPFFTTAEWQQTEPGKREVLDGRMHLIRANALKAQPFADGAIRARIQYQPDTAFVGFLARHTDDKGGYKVELDKGRSAVLLSHFPLGSIGRDNLHRLGEWIRPKPLQPGDTLLLELRLEGDHLTVLVDGNVAIEARDSRAPGPGLWGLATVNGWFDSVEVQTPLPAAAPPETAFGPWQPLFTEAEWKETKPGQREVVDGRLHLLGVNALKPQPAADGAIRARIQRPQGSSNVAFHARRTSGAAYRVELSGDGIVKLSCLLLGDRTEIIQLGQRDLPKRRPPGATVLLELRMEGDRLTVLADGAALIEVRDSRPAGPSLWGISATDGWFESVEVQTPAPAAPSAPGAGPAIAATKDAPFVNTLGMKFVPVPGTKVLFSIWDTRVQDYAAYAQAKQVDDSWKTQQKDGVPVGREADHPVVGANWDDAHGFCQWLTEKEIAEGKLPKGVKYRLPSDEEWSWAVGMPPELGTTPAKKNGKNSVDFPWGKDYPPTKKVGNYADETFHAKFPPNENAKDYWNQNGWLEGYNDGYATTSPVGSFPANAYGLYDLGGNVFQWCEDWFDNDHKHRVLRGTSWYFSDRGALLSSHRFNSVPTARNGSHGFRCVVAISAPAATSAAAAAGWEDLLAPLTPELVAQTSNGWRLEGGALHSPNKKFGTLPLPGNFSSSSYQLRIKLRQLAPKEVFHVCLPVGDRMTAFELDGYGGNYTGLNLVDGKTLRSVPGVVEGKQVKDAEPHDLVVTVRLDGASVKITATLDARPLYEWTGPATAPSREEHWASTPPGSLALGASADDWVISEVKAKRLVK